MNNQVFKILLVEDDEIEQLKFERAVKKTKHHFSLTVAINGEDALRQCKCDCPNLIFLDLNMPKMNGLELLSILKKDSILSYIPVMILTTSDNQQDKLKAYSLGIAGYVLKPLRYPEYVDNIKIILDYWTLNVLV